MLLQRYFTISPPDSTSPIVVLISSCIALAVENSVRILSNCFVEIGNQKQMIIPLPPRPHTVVDLKPVPPSDQTEQNSEYIKLTETGRLDLSSR